jgi:uncharacterized surface protein with fasciclin (FAS1) repeats
LLPPPSIAASSSGETRLAPMTGGGEKKDASLRFVLGLYRHTVASHRFVFEQLRLEEHSQELSRHLGAAKEAGGLATFLSLIDEAGLKDSLTAPGARTVFAPSDPAFAALPRAELDRLRKNKKKLAALLAHPIVPGTTLTAADLAARPADAPPLRTTAGTELQPPPLERQDLAAINGVLHIIPTVLQPGKPTKKPTEPAPDAKPVDPTKKPADAKPTDAKPVEPTKKPADAKPVEPAEPKPAEPKPAEPKKPDTKPVEPATKPASKPAEPTKAP